MPVTLTIKSVPDTVADALRQRAQAGRRSLQQELLLIVEEAAGRQTSRVAELTPRVYALPASQKSPAAHEACKDHRLGLEALWQRARQLGSGPPNPESAAIVRADRDARDRR